MISQASRKPREAWPRVRKPGWPGPTAAGTAEPLALMSANHGQRARADHVCGRESGQAGPAGLPDRPGGQRKPPRVSSPAGARTEYPHDQAAEPDRQAASGQPLRTGSPRGRSRITVSSPHRPVEDQPSRPATGRSRIDRLVPHRPVEDHRLVPHRPVEDHRLVPHRPVEDHRLVARRLDLPGWPTDSKPTIDCLRRLRLLLLRRRRPASWLDTDCVCWQPPVEPPQRPLTSPISPPRAIDNVAT